jgi:hypothetical protein
MNKTSLWKSAYLCVCKFEVLKGPFNKLFMLSRSLLLKNIHITKKYTLYIYLKSHWSFSSVRSKILLPFFQFF